MNNIEELVLAPDASSFSSFEAFYPFYLNEHSNITCRRLHFIGSTLSLICLVMLVVTFKPQYFLYGWHLKDASKVFASKAQRA